jgi:hypothetical protein
MKPRFADRLGAAALLALPSLLMARALAAGAIPYFMDTAMYFFPLRAQAARVTAAGEWPLWNRGLAGGMPLFENPQAALAYPFHWPSLAWPGGFWFTFPMTLQLGLAAALTGWALRRAGAGRGAAWWGGALTLAGGYGWSRLQFGNYINVLPWLPLWLGAAHAWARGGSRRWLGAGGAAVALMLSGGAHQLAAYGLAGLGIYSLAQAALDRRARRRWIGFYLLAVGLGAAMGAPGWLPAIGFLQETGRGGGLDPERVLMGAIGSWGELARALLGDWNAALANLSGGRGAAWADAELTASIGILGLALACVPPARGRRRRAWAACWIAALATAALASRPASGMLMELSPRLGGLFHDPRRWLGATQWLLILAAGLGLDGLMRRIPRARWAWHGLAATAVAAAGWMTWWTTDLAMIPARALSDPDGGVLLARAELKPGERFYALDWQRAFSYDYRRPDLTEWALPNLGMLWGAEDLGAYEPAQSKSYRQFIEAAQGGADAVSRRVWPEHFGLATRPWDAAALAAGNIRVALVPRWGLPLYFRPAGPQPGGGAAWIAEWGDAGTDAWEVRAMVIGEAPGALNGDLRGAMLRADGRGPALELADAAPPGLDDDLVLLGMTNKLELGARMPPPLAGPWILRGTLPPGASTQRAAWVVTLPAGARLIDVYAWSDTLRATHRPIAMGEIATLCRVTGVGDSRHASISNGEVIAERIGNNWIEIDAMAPGGGGRLVVRDAWWPGWRAVLDGDIPIEIEAEGMWRVVELPAGRHTLRMEYLPPLAGASLWIALAGGLGICGVACGGCRRRKPMNVK